MPGIRIEESIKQLENETREYKKIVDERKFDETGALKEPLFHKDLSNLISEYIEFDPQGRATLKSGGEQRHIIGVSTRDLKRANKERGHFGGDTLLNNTVITSQRLINDSNLQANIYHAQASDFFLIAEGGDTGAEYFVNQTMFEKIAIGNGIEEGRISSSKINLQEIVDFYNKYIETVPQEMDDLLIQKRRKMITGQAIQLLTFRQERQKLIDVWTDLHEISEKGRDAEEYFTLYDSSIFRGYGIETFSELEKTEDFGKLAFKIAFDRVYGESTIPLYIWTSLSEKVDEYAQASRIYGEEAVDINVQIEDQALLNKLESSADIIRQFALEKYLFRTEKGRILNSIVERIRALPVNVTNLPMAQYDEFVALANYLYMYFEHDEEKKSIWNDIRNGIAETKDRIQEIHERKAEGEEHAEDWTLDLHYQRISKFRELAHATLDRISMETDMLTGLKNKDTYRNDLCTCFEHENAENEFGVISLDMGFLQYFNNIGSPDRKVGDLAINKTAYILEEVGRKLAEKGIKVSAYRTGGDEFSLIVEGSVGTTQEAFNLLFETNLERNKISEGPNGLVPMAPGCKRTYVPRMLQFDAGYVHSSKTKEIVNQLVTSDYGQNVFNEADRIILEQITGSSPLTMETLTPEQKEMYTSTLAEVMMRTVDKIIEENKRQLRFKLLLEKYIDLKIELNTVDLELKMDQFKDILAFSGKSTNGKTIEDFQRIVDYAKINRINVYKLEDTQLEILCNEFYSNDNQTPKKSELEDLVEIFNERRNK